MIYVRLILTSVVDVVSLPAVAPALGAASSASGFKAPGPAVRTPDCRSKR